MEARDQNIIIIGGGLAGLCCALHLLKSDIKVTLIEKLSYPQHKVCGEYISNEVIPYLKWLDADPSELHPSSISELLFSIPSGKTLTCKLPLGGFGISRYALDHFLYKKAIEKGCTMITDTVTAVSYEHDNFQVTTAKKLTLSSALVIGAYGKRNAMDQKLKRSFFFKKTPWLAVKSHYRGDFPDELVALHNFKGGYCGVSKIEDGHLNICYLADYKSFKKFKYISEFEQEVLRRNPQLNLILENCTPLFKQPLSIAQISFAKKEAVHEHILMIGDTAGLIHPLCGNGMAMAIHSAKLCAELIVQYKAGSIITRAELESQYQHNWNRNFKSRLTVGRLLSSLIRNEYLLKPFWLLLVTLPSLLPFIIKKTHGKPIE
ncbi:NAD(P)/FAD-dependent oxidoreductase [Pedobacter sp. GR22-6]|uniref:NAD(P)/FAD-dependent oxidoreductase n=1 Tax=Pedobacter sp. GR22-6 TaxID=3127957 RepID=UPI00307E3F5C